MRIIKRWFSGLVVARFNQSKLMKHMRIFGIQLLSSISVLGSILILSDFLQRKQFRINLPSGNLGSVDFEKIF